MLWILKLIAVFLLISLSVGCRLAVIVVEGGHVVSDQVGVCEAGTVCITEITDSDFSTSFTAIPDPDWYFFEWKTGDRFICGGSTGRLCNLSLDSYENREAIQTLVASSEIAYLMPIFKQYPESITAAGREWMQPASFFGIKPTSIRQVCPLPEGVCSGSLNSVDMTGWTWASVEEVGLLFNHYGYPEDLVWGQWFRAGWRPTNGAIIGTLGFYPEEFNVDDFGYCAETRGVTRTLFQSSNEPDAIIYSVSLWTSYVSSMVCRDTSNGGYSDRNFQGGDHGAWFWR